jgi:hypothetical protein
LVWSWSGIGHNSGDEVEGEDRKYDHRSLGTKPGDRQLIMHLLVYVPETQALDDAEFGRRLAVLYDRTMVRNLMEHIGKLREDWSSARP